MTRKRSTSETFVEICRKTTNFRFWSSISVPEWHSSDESKRFLSFSSVLERHFHYLGRLSPYWNYTFEVLVAFHRTGATSLRFPGISQIFFRTSRDKICRLSPYRNDTFSCSGRPAPYRNDTFGVLVAFHRTGATSISQKALKILAKRGRGWLHVGIPSNLVVIDRTEMTCF